MERGRELGSAWSARENQCLFVSAESLKIGFLNTLKETPGTYPSAGLGSRLLGAALGRDWAPHTSLL